MRRQHTTRSMSEEEIFTMANASPGNRCGLDAAMALVILLCASFVGGPAWAAIGIDATSSGDHGTAANSVSTPSFSTTAGNELLLAFISTDYLSGANTTVTGVSGAGLSWVRVVRTNAQRGTSEIWRAFTPAPLSNVVVTASLSQSVASSITVMSFTGVDTSGTNGAGAIGASQSASARSGAPKATLVTTRDGSWVFGVGNDYDQALARTPGPGQSLVHQYLAPIGDTYWVQRQNGPTPLSNTSVTINDTAPTGDLYNLSIVEVLPSAGSTSPTATSTTTATPTATATGTATAFPTATAPGAATATPTATIPTATATLTSTAAPSATATSVGQGADWLTYGHDPQRSGNAAGESLINPTSVKTLALRWSAGVDGKVTGQPLFVSAAQVAGQTHAVVVVGTANNSVYALDAGSGSQLWRRHFGAPSGQGDVPGGFGISASPVIDRTSNRVYTVTDDSFLRTLALADGTDAVAPLQVIPDNPATNSVWGGLNLIGGSLYIVTASNGPDTNPWRGRILRVDVSGTTPSVVGTFIVVPSIPPPNGGGGIWGYGGASVDPSNGRVYVATGADSPPYSDTVPEGYAPYAARMVALAGDLGYSLPSSPLGNPLGSYEPPHPSPCPGEPGVCDMDFGATPVIYQPPGCPTLVAAVNKDGHIYVLRADDLAASLPPLQALALNIAFDGPGEGGLTGVPAYWPAGNMLFVTAGGPGINGINAGVAAMSVSAAPACTLQVAWSVTLAAAPDQPPSSPTVANGVVFVGSGVDGSVHAFDATSGTELWNSGNAITGGATFAAPMVAAGTLYAASWNGFSAGAGGTVRAFALGTPPTATPTSTPGPSPTASPPSSVLLGDQAIESAVDDNALDVAEAFQATASASGTVGVLSIYLDSSSTVARLVAGIYADSAGHPGALLAQGSSTQLSAGAWNAVQLPGASVTAANPYWIAILGTQSGTLRFRDRATGCKSETSAQTNLTALPSTWSTGTVYPSCPLSAYGSTSP